jgi:hypothetical protein
MNHDLLNELLQITDEEKSILEQKTEVKTSIQVTQILLLKAKNSSTETK